MKLRIAVVFGALVFLVFAVGCADSPRRYDPDAYPCDAECEAQRQADLEYMVKNYPTREQALRVRECVTARTGYEYENELPIDYGPELLTKPRTAAQAKPIQEDMPFRLVEKALVAAGQRKPLRERVYSAREDCIYQLGLEERFFTPSYLEGRPAVRNS